MVPFFSIKRMILLLVLFLAWQFPIEFFFPVIFFLFSMILLISFLGADVVDAALDSMSGITSQPSVGALIASLGDEVGIIYSLFSNLSLKSYLLISFRHISFILKILLM